MIRHAATRLRIRGSRQEGQAFIVVALLLAVFGGMAALVVDIGSMTTDRRDLQNAADAIALAASQALPNQDAAQAVANQWAAKNDIALSEMELTFVAQNVPSVPNPKVIVKLTQDHEFTFARLIGVTSAEVGATAAAIRTSPGGSAGLVPWSVTRATLDAITPGVTTVMKYDSNGVTSGNFGAIQLDGSGANVYRDTAEFGSSNGLCATGNSSCSYPSTAQVETGNMVGATRTAVDYRMDNTSASCDTWAEVTQVAGNGSMSLQPACNPFLPGGDPNSLRIIVIPVIASLCNGSCTVTITEFALFFLEGYDNGQCNGNDCDIQGRFIASNTNYGAQVGVFGADTLAHFVRLVQ